MVETITVEELAERLKDPTRAPLLLDVRESDERATALIGPSIHIPMGQIAQRAGEIPTDRPLVVYCHFGGRSAMVAGFLEHHGHPEIANLDGGIDAWAERIDPTMARY